MQVQTLRSAPLPSRRPAPAPAAQPAPAPTPAPAPPQAASAPGRSERIASFLGDLQAKSVANLRVGSAAYAGQLVGMAIGAAIFAPIAIATANAYVLTGGSALVGGATCLGAYYLDKHLASKGLKAPDNAAVDAALGVGAALRAVPRFAYPSLMNATEAERALIYNSLDRMPMASVTSASTMQVVDGLERTGAIGIAHPQFAQTHILLDKDALTWGYDFHHELISHEVGHSRDFVRGAGPLGAHSLIGPFGKAPFLTDYSGTNRMEDFAETHAHYHMGESARAELARATPEKFRVMDELSQPGLSEQWAGQKGVRETGKKVGQALEAAPYLRNALELAGALIAPAQIHRGARGLEAGLVNGDARQKFHGKMNLASGLFLLAPGGAVGALAVNATHGVLSGLVHEGKLEASQADRISSGVLAAATGPVGMVYSAIGSELAAAGVDVSRGPALTRAEAGGGGVLAVIGGSSAGLFLGATIGGALGGVGGAMAGSFWGSAGGAALGLAGWSLLSMRSERASSSYDLTKGDKLFLAKVVGGGVLGGTAGTILGGHLGKLAGAAVGGALAGPAGAVTGAFLGRFAGICAGSLALGRAGAWAGRKLD